jgi:hypothetical protein
VSRPFESPEQLHRKLELVHDQLARLERSLFTGIPALERRLLDLETAGRPGPVLETTRSPAPRDDQSPSANPDRELAEELRREIHGACHGLEEALRNVERRFDSAFRDQASSISHWRIAALVGWLLLLFSILAR